MVYQAEPSAVAIFATFPNIPQDLVKFVRFCLQRNHHNRLTHLLLKNPIAFSETLDKFFSDLSRLTGLTPDVILRTTGFNFRDTDQHESRPPSPNCAVFSSLTRKVL